MPVSPDWRNGYSKPANRAGVEATERLYQGSRRNQNPVSVGVQELTGDHGHPGESDIELAFPRPFLVAASRMRGQGLNSERQLDKFSNIPDATVDQNTRPPVLHSRMSQSITEQGTTQGSSAIHDQHPAFTRRSQLFCNPGIILEAFYRDDGSAKRFDPAKVHEHRFHHLDSLAVGVTEIR